MERLLEILRSLRPDVDFEAGERLVDDGLLDSFDIIALVGELEAAFGVSVGLEELEFENFNSAGAIMAMLKRLGYGA